MIDYTELLGSLKAELDEEVADFGGLLSHGEIAELTGISGSQVRARLKALADAGKVRRVSRNINGTRGYMYSAKDVYEVCKDSKCLDLELHG